MFVMFGCLLCLDVCYVWMFVMFVINLARSLDRIIQTLFRCDSKWYGSVLIDTTVCFEMVWYKLFVDIVRSRQSFSLTINDL